jgi:hypothetical protein
MKKLPRISKVEPRAGYRLGITLEGGERFTADMSGIVARGGVFAALADETKFADVRVDERGRKVEWEAETGVPGPIDIDAESLLQMGMGQTMSARLRRLLKDAGLLRRAAEKEEQTRPIVDSPGMENGTINP